MFMRSLARSASVWLLAGLIAALIDSSMVSTFLCKPVGMLKLPWVVLGLVDDPLPLVLFPILGVALFVTLYAVQNGQQPRRLLGSSWALASIAVAIYLARSVILIAFFGRPDNCVI